MAAADELDDDEDEDGAEEELDDEAAEDDLEDEAAEEGVEDDVEDDTAELDDDDHEELEEDVLDFNEDATEELFELTDVATLDELKLAALLETSEDVATELAAEDATNPPPPAAPPPPQAARDKDANAIPAPAFTPLVAACSGSSQSSTSFVCMVLPLGGVYLLSGLYPSDSRG